MKEIVAASFTLALVFAITTSACGNDPRITDASDGSGSGSAEPNECRGTSAYLQTCEDPSTCMGCNCQIFGHEFYCSPNCHTVADCPAPATACTNGYCMK